MSDIAKTCEIQVKSCKITKIFNSVDYQRNSFQNFQSALKYIRLDYIVMKAFVCDD